MLKQKHVYRIENLFQNELYYTRESIINSNGAVALAITIQTRLNGILL